MKADYIKLAELLEPEVQEAVVRYSWSAQRQEGRNWAVWSGSGLVGYVKYNQMRRKWQAVAASGYVLGNYDHVFGALGQLNTLATKRRRPVAPDATLTALVTFELDERVRRAIGRRLGLDGPAGIFEFEHWVKHEVEAAVAETEALLEESEEKGESDGL